MQTARGGGHSGSGPSAIALATAATSAACHSSSGKSGGWSVGTMHHGPNPSSAKAAEQRDRRGRDRLVNRRGGDRLVLPPPQRPLFCRHVNPPNDPGPGGRPTLGCSGSASRPSFCDNRAQSELIERIESL